MRNPTKVFWWFLSSPSLVKADNFAKPPLSYIITFHLLSLGFKRDCLLPVFKSNLFALSLTFGNLTIDFDNQYTNLSWANKLFSYSLQHINAKTKTCIWSQCHPNGLGSWPNQSLLGFMIFLWIRPLYEQVTILGMVQISILMIPIS